ncbi:hypothetical protein AB0J86_12320 [Micromonospora sp. NPDC049559]|uniref:hypothetical protein n=1 Tax=Micromonospora sp. NPDC049559 TaxID=3155923 RepID=UPI0034314C48
MSLSPRPGEESPLDLATLTGDDRLLDALGRGDPPPADEPAAGLLAAWRADLDDDPPAWSVDAGLDADPAWSVGAGLDDGGGPPVGAAGPAADAGRTAGGRADSAVVRTARAVPGPGERRPPSAPPERRRTGSTRRLLTGIAAATVMVAGLGVGAHHAGPASPLWPVVRVVYPQRADVRAIEQDLAAAGTAVADGRYDDARGLLARADSRVGRVRDPQEADRLRGDIARLRADLPIVDGDVEGAPGPAASGPAAPAGSPAPARSAGPTSAPGRSAAASSPGQNRVNPVPPPLPPSPLPSLLAPLLPSLGLLGALRGGSSAPQG